MNKNKIYNRYIKRMLDFLFALAAVVALAPLFLVIAAAIKLDSRGPVFFTQKRMGLAQRDFIIFKFRSMVRNAPQIGEPFTVRGDSRVTQIGRLLRYASLDELPQIFNILRGEMSFVGPRPDVRELARFDDPLYVKRFEVKPGLTGMAQVYGRSESTPENKSKMDARYVDDLSFTLDLKLTIQTIAVVLLRRGVN